MEMEEEHRRWRQELGWTDEQVEQEADRLYELKENRRGPLYRKLKPYMFWRAIFVSKVSKDPLAPRREDMHQSIGLLLTLVLSFYRLQLQIALGGRIGRVHYRKLGRIRCASIRTAVADRTFGLDLPHLQRHYCTTYQQGSFGPVGSGRHLFHCRRFRHCSRLFRHCCSRYEEHGYTFYVFIQTTARGACRGPCEEQSILTTPLFVVYSFLASMTRRLQALCAHQPVPQASHDRVPVLDRDLHHFHILFHQVCGKECRE